MFAGGRFVRQGKLRTFWKRNSKIWKSPPHTSFIAFRKSTSRSCGTRPSVRHTNRNGGNYMHHLFFDIFFISVSCINNVKMRQSEGTSKPRQISESMLITERHANFFSSLLQRSQPHKVQPCVSSQKFIRYCQDPHKVLTSLSPKDQVSGIWKLMAGAVGYSVCEQPVVVSSSSSPFCNLTLFRGPRGNRHLLSQYENYETIWFETWASLTLTLRKFVYFLFLR